MAGTPALPPRSYPRVAITAEMLAEAQRLGPLVRVHRTQASPMDDVAGVLGELAFAQWAYGDWRRNRVGSNKGQADFGDVEVKASAFPFRDTLNLLVREDYGRKRKPAFYVQVILDLPSRGATLAAGMEAVVAGWATAQEVDAAPLKDFGSKFGGDGGYRCFHIAIRELRDMAAFREAYGARQASGGALQA